jgi:hypothetical protein
MSTCLAKHPKESMNCQKVYELKRSFHTSRESSKTWQHRYAPDRKEMEKEKGKKRKSQESSKRKEQRKITTRWKPTFWTQEPARMADD